MPSKPFLLLSDQIPSDDDLPILPVNVITGFLGAGKTTLLNRLMKPRLDAGKKLLCVQFEEGEDDLDWNENLTTVSILPGELKQDSGKVLWNLYATMVKQEFDEVWVEWNGMQPIQKLFDIFPSHPTEDVGAVSDLCRLSHILFIAESTGIVPLLTQTGGVLTQQLLNSDVLVLRGTKGRAEFQSLRRAVRNANPGIQVLPVKNTAAIASAMEQLPSSPILVFSGLCLLFLLGERMLGTTFSNLITVFLGVVLQAVPFLLVGVLLSSAIQMFLSPRILSRLFPKQRLRGALFAVAAGFCLPVCDCASIPIFRSLLRKGVPVSSAVTFMLVTPIINPVVLLSTWYAWRDWRFVACRAGLGILCSILIGLTFCRTTAKDTGSALDLSSLLCSCGMGTPAASSRSGKFFAYLRHTQAEFFNVGKYLMAGAFVSAVLQSVFKAGAVQSIGGLAGSLLVMMGLAFVLSLCSSSDAVVARSFSNTVPTGAVIGFLVFGPMLDIKNVIMLSGSLPRRFLLRLGLTIFLVDFVVLFLAFHFGLGVFLG